jgi:hypothetical protein
VEDLAAVDDAFESDEGYEAFLADLYASRRRAPVSLVVVNNGLASAILE